MFFKSAANKPKVAHYCGMTKSHSLRKLLMVATLTKKQYRENKYHYVDLSVRECVYSWYDMASTGCPYCTSYYTISALSGRGLTFKDIVRKKDYHQIEELLKKELAVQIYHKTKSKMQDMSFLDKQDGIALIKEGLVIYFHPYSIGCGYDGQYNVVITYDELKENNIKLKVR